jgi:GABA(A) receptor-associated protein
MSSFKKNNAFEKRIVESKRIKIKYPDKIPVIIEKNKTEKDIPDIDKNKYLVPLDLTLGQFIFIIRKRIKLNSSKGLFLFISDKKILAPTTKSFNDLYTNHQDKDGYLYLTYSSENTFGSLDYNF